MLRRTCSQSARKETDHRAELVSKASPPLLVYRFYPYDIDYPELSGEFVYNIDTGETLITVEVDAVRGRRPPDRAVFALVAKLKRLLPEVPERFVHYA